MNETIPNIRLRVFAFADHKQTTNDVINNFDKLLTAEYVFDKRWGLKRIKVKDKENTFDIGGGRLSLPKRQITFDNEIPPDEILSELKDNKIEEDIQTWCNSADIFLLCIDLNNKPETENIARLTWRIKQTNRKKTILYAIINCEQQSDFSTFDEYAKLSVALQTAIKQDGQLQTNMSYYFPNATNSQGFVENNNHFDIHKKIFCFSESGIGYIDCLLFCINQLYRGIAEIKITNNKAYHYLTTNIKFNNNTNMAKKIKLAVVGASGNGKTHFMHDVLHTLEHLNLGLKTDLFSGYAQANNFWNSQNAFKQIELTNPEKFLTKNEQHYKGVSKNGSFTLEFMDIQGEAFSNADVISGVYTNLKECLIKCYNYNLFKRVFDKKKNTFFVEEHWTQGDSTTITIRLNTDKSETPKRKESNNMPIDKEEETESVMESKTPVSDKPDKAKNRGGKYLVKHFEKYETESLINALKEVVRLQQENPLSEYKDRFKYTVRNSDGTTVSQQLSQDARFWKYFYAYVFCENCTDFVICDLLAVPKSEKTETLKEDDGFENCINGCNHFLDKSPRKYLVFRGMDAMLKETDECITVGKKQITKNILHTLYGTSSDKVGLATSIYFLIHLAIYKKFLKNNSFDTFISQVQGKNLLFEKLPHLDNINDILDSIINDDDKYVVPNDKNGNGITYRLNERIKKLFGQQYVFAKDVVEGVENNIIYPHTYFTAYSVNSINLKIHKNALNSSDFGDDFEAKNRLPLGTYNFVTDLLYNNKVEEELNRHTNMESLLYYNKS